MKVCLAAAEAAPLAKTGGLGDVTSALAAQLSARGHDVRLFLPFYDVIDLGGGETIPVEFLRDVPLTMGGRELRFTVSTTRLPGTGLWVYLVRCSELFERGGIYTGDEDEYLRFACLTRAVIESCQRMGWSPDVFHVNDWHTALLPLYLRRKYGWDRLFEASRTLLTIHNIAHQGVFPSGVLDALDLGREASFFDPADLEARRINYLKTGIVRADRLSTVSPTHALEIQTPEYGRGLEPWLRKRAKELVGILNGVDYSRWSPETDPLIPYAYSVDDLSGKEKVKHALLDQLSLAYDPRAPVVGIVARLVEQKGLELLFEPMPRLLGERDLRFVVLGAGEPVYEAFFTRLQRDHPGKVCFYRGFSEPLAHLIEAGSDIFLMPSAYEPCGLNQMYSLRYGTVPVVRQTGGLADSVEPFDAGSGEGTGFVFQHFTPEGLSWALRRALETFQRRETWRRLMRNGMTRDFSWEQQTRRYEELYREMCG